MFTDETRFQVCTERAVAKVIGDEAIVIDTVTGRYYSLEGSGEVAWTLLAASLSLAEVAEALGERYEVEPAVALADVRHLAEELVDEQLIRVADGTVGGPTPELNAAHNGYVAPSLTVFRDMEELLAFDPPLPGANTTVWTAERHEP